jgi:glucose-6-phosphate isomerase
MSTLSLSLQAKLGAYQGAVEAALQQMQAGRIVARIWEGDHTVWKPDPTEIHNRLGWLRVAETMQPKLPRLDDLRQAAQQAGYTHALLLGMGGSSLAPDMLRKTFGVQPGGLDLAVLDSTDPGAVLAHAARLDPARTLFIVSTKSGGTVETFSLFRYFYNWTAAQLGSDGAGEHFIAITDPESALVEVAQQYRFGATLTNGPDIGGRYSALSFFGLAPAALCGIPVERLVERAQQMMAACQGTAADQNPAARLGAALGELAKAGRDKFTLVTSPAICNFGDWVEQLVAESTGKEGRGILPVVGEPPGAPEDYGADRLFVYLRLAGDHTHDVAMLALESAGFPVLRLEMGDLYDLGAQFFLWELATAIACHCLGVQPFDQPDVEAAKAQARKMVAAYQAEGHLPELTPALRSQGIAVYGESFASSLHEAWDAFLAHARRGSYVAVQAYLEPGDASDASLIALRSQLRQRTRLAVTTGYGPRFLHSTGQLHKGDAGLGLFVQITHDPAQDVAIPDEAGKTPSSMTFGVLELAQALGDRQALLDNGRRVIRFHLGQDTSVGMESLARALEHYD